MSAAFAIVSCRLTSMGCTRDAMAPPSVGRPIVYGAPGLHLPRQALYAGARDLWSMCLIHALASVVAHRDERSWVDLLTMPALTLGRPSRGGRPAVRIGWTVCAPSFGSRLANPPLIRIRAPTSVCPVTSPTASPPSSKTAPSGGHAQYSTNPGTVRPGYSLGHRWAPGTPPAPPS